MATLARIWTTGGPLPAAGDEAALDNGWRRWLEVAAGDDELAAFARRCRETPPVAALLNAVFGHSPFLAKGAIADPSFTRLLIEEGPDAAFALALEGARERSGLGAESTAAVMKRLRIAKRRAALAIALADIASVWPLEKLTGALSDFAAATLAAACRHLLRGLHDGGRLPLARPDDPERDCGLIVLGMGKLGGGELNYSSDVDVILLYDEERLPEAARERAGRLFAKLARDLVQIMEQRTVDGYVFRTDLRLRPDPGSTPPAVSVAAALRYYASQGRTWERAAMIKARPVAGDGEAGRALLEALRPFVWRRYLDFATIQDVGALKRQIDAHRGGGEIAVAGHNVKLGRGGIREIEFFAQTQQLIFGGREPALRCRATCQALDALAAAGRIDAATAAGLKDAYGELRRVEHRLQMIDDAQTHSLPAADGLDHIATFLGYGDRRRFERRLTALLRRVEAHYADLFEGADPLFDESGEGAGNLVFTGNEDDPDTLRTLARMGFADGAAIAEAIRGWHHGRVRAMRSARAREILTELMPRLLAAFAATCNPDGALMRFHEMLERLPAGVQFFSLLQNDRATLELVAEIMGNAPGLAEYLARAPTLLDHVFSRDFFAVLPAREALEANLDGFLAGAEHDEEVLDRARRWMHEREFQLGVQLLRGLIGPDRVARALTDLTDAVLRLLLPRVEEAFARRHGRVAGGAMAVVAFGKYGSGELNFGSDLDLVFVYGHDEGAEASDGARPLAPGQYFIRLSQRLLTALTSMTNAGRLFEIDMRLRPSGHAGPLACDVAGFVRYEERDAWMWEHMALTRARVAVAPAALAARLEAAIRGVLTAPRRRAPLAATVADMRRRIADEHPPGGRFEVKYARGGLIELDFIAQYLQLLHAPARPQVLARRAEDAFQRLAAAGLLGEGLARDLAAAARLMKDVQTAARLATARAGGGGAPVPALRDLFARLAGMDDFEALLARLAEAQARVAAAFEEVVVAAADAVEKTGRGEP